MPAAKLVLSSVVTPPPQLKVYGALPPVGVRLMDPFVPPKQDTLVVTLLPDTPEVGWVIVAETTPVQPLASVMVTE